MPHKFEKRRERHAIGEFSASMRFFQPLDVPAFSEAVVALRKFAESEKLPAPVTGKTFAINLANADATPIAMTSNAGWQRFAPDGEPELSVVCDPTTIAYTSRNYTNWEDMLPKLTSFFGQIAEYYVKSVPGVSVFQVNYLNEFRSLSDTADSGREVFREKTAWLPSRLNHFADAWHSHCGAFEDISDSARRLVNINVDCRAMQVEELPHPATLITAHIVVSRNYDLPGKPPLILSSGDMIEKIRENFDEIHRREKEILAELLADEYLIAIGAKEKSDGR